MKLLISPINIEEAEAASNGGADIIDVKNPKEGSLGANFPWVIRAVKEAVNSKSPISATIGDMNYKPGTASLAALGAAVSGADFVKVGLYDIQTREQAVDMAEHVVKSVKDYDPNKKVVISGYSDFKRINSIPVWELPSVCAECGADVVMMDTGIKDIGDTQDLRTFDNLVSSQPDRVTRSVFTFHDLADHPPQPSVLFAHPIDYLGTSQRTSLELLDL